MASTNHLRPLLHRIGTGDRSAYDAVFQDLYAELHDLAVLALTRHRSGEPSQGATDAGGLLHDTYLRLLSLVGGSPIRSTGHFLALARRDMRAQLIEERRAAAHARQVTHAPRRVA